ncbi:sulfotransferase domain-containing protein [Psychroserpens sp.]|uniref:sulfotransferase domain-containing protein n=1 Tax=Psychroserpens sp. TaxID=2020870 RepID=UPI00385A3671
MKANLFIAGACKSGTTFLHDVLSQQDDVIGANPKEPYFFELPKRIRDVQEYHSKYFEAYTNQKYLLDSRHRTMFFSWIPKDLYDYNPESKLIFMLRNPIDRAYSHWWMWYSRGVIKTSFDETIKNEMKSIQDNGSFMDISPEDYHSFVRNNSHQQRLAYADANTVLESGYYFEQIKRFQDYFDNSNMLILNFNMVFDLPKMNKTLSEFLDIEITDSAINKRQNKAKNYKQTKHVLAPFLPNWVKRKVKDVFFKKPKISSKTYTLLQEHYKEHNKKLISEFNLQFVKEWQSN